MDTIAIVYYSNEFCPKDVLHLYRHFMICRYQNVCVCVWCIHVCVTYVQLLLHILVN